MATRTSTRKPTVSRKASKPTSRNAVAKQAASPQKWKVTYATLGMPSSELHDHFDQALERVRAGLGQTHPMLTGGQPVTSDESTGVNDLTNTFSCVMLIKYNVIAFPPRRST